MMKMTLVEWAEEQHKKGLQEGRHEGETLTALKIAHAMLSHGIAVATVAETTGVSIEQLNELNG